MIIKALVDYYEALAEQGRIAQTGWCNAKISYALNISKSGELLNVIPLFISEQRGKKTVFIPQNIKMPEGVKRTSGISAQFLWNNAQYMLGLPKDSNEEHARKCFLATAEKANLILKNSSGEKAIAIKQFYSKWNPKDCKNNSVLQPYLAELLGSCNITIFVENDNVISDLEIKQAWEDYCNKVSDGEKRCCAITGRADVIARLHPNIKGVRGAHSSGAALVSFNAPAFESYGHKQGDNANIGEYAAFAYTTALNSLLSDSNHCTRIGDTTIVFWAEHANEGCALLFGEALENINEINEDDLKAVFKNINEGKAFEFCNALINPSNKFFVLGLSPNAARLSVRFFMANTFGFFMNNFARYCNELAIDKPAYDNKQQLAIWQILAETANKKSKDKAASPLLTGAVLRSILNGSRYPLALYQNIILRVKSDQDDPDKYIYKVNRIKSAIIKAFLLRNVQEKGEFTVSLDLERKSAPYILGRLFAVLEQLQEEANPGINSTIKDRYFNSACATPGIIFPVLLKLSESHQKKILGNKGLSIKIKKTITELLGEINHIPSRLSLIDQGEFILGYYHQVQNRFKKKEEK